MNENLQFTEDWFTHNIPNWSKFLNPLEGKALNVLEIGCFEGRATKWLLENILTNEDSKITVIDTFEGSIEHRDGSANHDFSNTEAIFDFNVWMPYRHKVRKIKDTSFNALTAFNTGFEQEKFDLVYIDGSHMAKDVMADALLVWPLVKKNGLVIFDDYLWDPYPEPHKKPKMAIDNFTTMLFEELEAIHYGYQAIVKKTVE